MNISRHDLEQHLQSMSEHDAIPDSAFIDRLFVRIDHLPTQRPVAPPAKRSIPLPGVPWLIAAIFALGAGATGVGQFALSSDHKAQLQDVTTTTTPAIVVPPNSSRNAAETPSPIALAPANTTTTIHGVESTTTIPAANSGAAPITIHSEPATTATSPRHELTTTTTTVPPTTTTAVPASETLTLTCAAGTADGVPANSCTWSHSTLGSFSHYTLIRWVGTGGSSSVIATSTNRTQTTWADKAVTSGVVYSYAAVEYNGNGSIVGYSKRFTVS